MSSIKYVPTFFATVLFVLISTEVSAGLIVGETEGGNSYPFGGSDYSWGPEYYQIYGADAFDAPILLESLSFYRTLDRTYFTETLQGAYSLYLSITTTEVDSLSTNFDDNWRADKTLVFEGNLSKEVLPEDQLDIFFDQPFLYSPAAGNLLLGVLAGDLTIVPFMFLMFPEASMIS